MVIVFVHKTNADIDKLVSAYNICQLIYFSGSGCNREKYKNTRPRVTKKNCVSL